MKIHCLVIGLLQLVACTGSTKKGMHLKHTTWFSAYATYANYYTFLNDSLGTLEAGQVAWSSPIDLKNMDVPGNWYLYNDRDTFRYELNADTVLHLHFLSKTHAKSDRERIYRYSSLDSAWISDHEFISSKEYLRKGAKLRYMEEPLLIE
jgi:hypothetical protein